MGPSPWREGVETELTKWPGGPRARCRDIPRPPPRAGVPGPPRLSRAARRGGGRQRGRPSAGPVWLLIQKGSVSVDTAVPISMPFPVFPPPLRLAPFSFVVLSFTPPFIFFFLPLKKLGNILKEKIAISLSFPSAQLGKNAKQSADVHISQAFLGGGRRWAENGGARGVGVKKLAAHERDYFRS